MGEKMKRLIDIPARKLLLLINNLSGAGFSSALAEKVSLDSNAAQAVELLEKAFLEPKVSSLEVVRVVPIEPMYVSTGSFNNMVTLGEYDYVDDEITEDRWIIERSGKGRVQKEPVLLRFFGRGKTEEVQAKSKTCSSWANGGQSFSAWLRSYRSDRWRCMVAIQWVCVWVAMVAQKMRKKRVFCLSLVCVAH